MTLLQAQKGHKHTITHIEGEPVVRERLSEMGFSPEEEIEVQRQLLWNGPLIVSVRGTQVALRVSEAECIHIQPTKA